MQFADGEGISTGINGLDQLLDGGFAFNRLHLVEGHPGTGKTTLALQFLMEGRSRGEKGLYVTLSETKAELLQVAESHGWSLDGIEIFELIPPEWSLDPKRAQSVIYASDLELGETVRLVLERAESSQATRIAFDSLAEIRLLSQSTLRYRRQVVALKHFFAQRGCTVLLLDDLTELADDYSLHSLAHGVIRLEQFALPYGAERRRLRVYKMRGRSFRGGFHDFIIRKGGISLFPRLVASDHPDQGSARNALTSGVATLDLLTGGGLDRGTATLLIGPSGSGKSSIAMQFVMSAISGGEKALFVTFDETKHVLMTRSRGMGWDLAPPIKDQSLYLEQIDPAEFSPGELTGLVCRHVEKLGVQVVVLDSLSGYQNAVPAEQYMLLMMHELLTYLNQQGIITILVLAQHGLVGSMQTPVDLTYLSDTVVLLRLFEAGGKIRRAMSVTKKRTGAHEDTIREYRLGSRGIQVGSPLAEFHGVLTGVPTYTGAETELLQKEDNDRWR